MGWFITAEKILRIAGYISFLFIFLIAEKGIKEKKKDYSFWTAKHTFILSAVSAMLCAAAYCFYSQIQRSNTPFQGIDAVFRSPLLVIFPIDMAFIGRSLVATYAGKINTVKGKTVTERIKDLMAKEEHGPKGYLWAGIMLILAASAMLIYQVVSETYRYIGCTSLRTVALVYIGSIIMANRLCAESRKKQTIKGLLAHAVLVLSAISSLAAGAICMIADTAAEQLPAGYMTLKTYIAFWLVVGMFYSFAALLMNLCVKWKNGNAPAGASE